MGFTIGWDCSNVLLFITILLRYVCTWFCACGGWYQYVKYEVTVSVIFFRSIETKKERKDQKEFQDVISL